MKFTTVRSIIKHATEKCGRYYRQCTWAKNQKKYGKTLQSNFLKQIDFLTQLGRWVENILGFVIQVIGYIYITIEKIIFQYFNGSECGKYCMIIL